MAIFFIYIYMYFVKNYHGLYCLNKIYIDKILENIGLIEEKHGWDEESFKVIKQYSTWINLTGSGYVDVGMLDDGRYIAQYCVQTDIDDYDITRLYFDHMPSEKDILTAKLIADIEFYFCIHKKSTFKCWECGNEVHWLDTPGNLEEKFENLKEKYCGC